MTNYKVSIIVPIYNVETYLERCVYSLQEQTYTNIEIILVDDGSQDKCGEICDRYALADERITVIHKKNGGLSDARNAGIERSSGDYLCFVDADDYVHSNFVQILLESCLKWECKISKCNIVTTSINENIYLQTFELPEYNIYTAERYLQEINRVNGGFNVCNKLFLKELFRDIRFPKGKLHEDVAVIYKLIACAEKIVEVNSDLYFYYNNTNSITKAKITVNRLDDLEFRLELFKFCMERNWRRAAEKNANATYNIILDYEMKNPEEFEDYHIFMKKFTKIKRKIYLKMFFELSISIKEKVYFAYKLLC